MTPLEDFLPLIRPYIQKCPDISLKLAIVRAARDFCRASWALSETIEVLSVEDQSTYLLEAHAPDQHEVIAVRGVEYSKQPLIAVDAGTISDQPSATPTSYYTASPDVLVLTPPPSVADESVVVRIITEPTVNCTHLHDHLYRRFDTAIIEGALYYLKSMPGELWSDLKAAPVHLARFGTLVQDAKNIVVRGNRPGSIYMEPVRFF